MKAVREVHASAGRLIQDAQQCQATLDSLPLEAQLVADHRAALKSAVENLRQARQLAAEASTDTSQAAEDLVDQATAVLRDERVFVGQQRLMATGQYPSIG